MWYLSANWSVITEGWKGKERERERERGRERERDKAPSISDRLYLRIISYMASVWRFKVMSNILVQNNYHHFNTYPPCPCHY